MALVIIILSIEYNASMYKPKFIFDYIKLILLSADWPDYLKSSKTNNFAVIYKAWWKIPFRCLGTSQEQLPKGKERIFNQ